MRIADLRKGILKNDPILTFLSFMIDGCDIIDFRKGTIALVKVNPIAHDKDVIDLSS